MIQLKRVYEPPDPQDGYRVLVDRLWPRGLIKAQARLDEWAKDLAPSNELRKRFHADRTKWVEFKREYRAELKGHGEPLQRLAARAKRGTVTLLYAATDSQRNHAIILAEVLHRLETG
jgi:uncharacterized protein YeaO (DUF488 family)